MMSLAIHRPFEYAPHATRSVAMALTLTLNLAILLFALRPSTPFVVQAPPPQSLLASILQPPPRPVAPPAVPILRVVKPVVVARVHIAIPQPSPITVPALPAIAPVAPVQITTATPVSSGTALPVATGNSSATIAYETATPPAYPVQALRAGTQGTVMLKVLVDTSGKPVRVVIEQSSGSRLLDEAARKHVLAAWRFHPAMRDGHVTAAWALVPVRFNLDRL